ncbi:MAG: winged helix-turn-helix transcriptional regulator [Bacilli bacterium]|nr:winged helix-turn-helix transcriptional regulator [Bacilli bacterium]
MKEIKLTKKQEKVLNYIKEYTAEHGFPPAVREIAKGVGLNSPSSVHSHIKRLERDGFIKKTNSKFRTIEVVGINEFKTDETKAIKLKLFQSNNLKQTKETFDFPASRVPKNVEIFAIKLNQDLKNISKESILIITVPKSYDKYDTLLIYNNDNLDLYSVIDKEKLQNDNLNIIGKIIEITVVL